MIQQSVVLNGKIIGFKKIWRCDLESELAKFNMTVKIDVGMNGTGIDEQANEYYNSEGVKISQENMLKIFSPKK